MPMHVEVRRPSLYGSATLLLKAEKSNKLSSNFRPSPFKVVQKTGTEITVRNEAGEEVQRARLCVQTKRERNQLARGSWTEGKRSLANHDRSVWKQPSASSEFAGERR